MNQISLSIPFQINLKLEKPLYFRYEKVDCGLISE